MSYAQAVVKLSMTMSITIC